MSSLKLFIKELDRKLGINLLSPARRLRGRRPKMLSVEPTNRCNLNCPFCLVGMQNTLPSTEHDLLARSLGMMDLGLYEKIARDAAEFGIETMQLHFQGEPLLHKQIHEMIRLAKMYGMSTQLFTNGLPLTEAMADRLLDAGLDLLRFSVDGVTEETYQKNRVGGEFARVYKNMKMMGEKARARLRPCKVEWQMIAMKNNENEIEKARQLSRDIGLDFFVKTFAVTDHRDVPSHPGYQRRLHLKPCLDIYRAIFVFWNGDVVPCCYDLEGKEVVGNLGVQTLTEVWESSRYRELRRRIDDAAVRPEEEPPLCKSCLKWGHDPFRTSDGQLIWGNRDQAGAGQEPDEDDPV